MRYCPNIDCPHRQRVEWPAEFLDHVLRCSDCGARLVASEEDAIAGRQPASAVPYRALAEVPREERAVPERRANERALGTMFIGIGAGASLFTYMLTGGAGRIHLVGWGVALYGLVRVVRAAVSRPSAGRDDGG